MPVIASTIFIIDENGNVAPWKEFRNSELITTFVWTHVISKYRETKKINGDQEVIVSPKEVIRTIKSGEIDLELFELAVTAMSLDRVIVKREHLLTLAALIDQFTYKYKDSARTSLLMQAVALRDIYQNPNIMAVCWQHGGGDNAWLETDSPDEEGKPYNIFKQQDHWLMFVNGFIPPARCKKEMRLVEISISYDIEDDLTQEALDILADQFRSFTTRTLQNSEIQIKVDVSKINKRIILSP
jgi:hypothetical protein